MTVPAATDVLVVVIAIVGGYLAGSLPLARSLVARAVLDAGDAVERVADGVDAWRLAGPGWGLLALVGDLAKGVVPVAIGLVTWSWAAGWAAGLGAVLGASQPPLRRLPRGSGVIVLVGVVFALAPPAGVVSLIVGLLVLAVARLVGRSGVGAALAAGLASFLPLFAALEQDPVRLLGVLLVYLVVAGGAIGRLGRRA